MAKGMSMKVLLQLQTREFQKGINSIKRQLQGFKSFMKTAFALGSVTMFGKQLVQVSKDFESAMARVQAVSNATTDEFRKMEAEALRLGSTTKYTASEAAAALENLTRNGMSAAKATKSLSTVLSLAQANSIDLATAANILTNTLNMFGLAVSQSTRVSDVLSSTASHAATDINLLYEALVNVAPVANSLGFSLEETASAIGALAQRGVKGAEAGTKLRVALQKMADPKVIKKMQEHGIAIDEMTIKTDGLYKTFEKISKANLSLGELGVIFDAKSAMGVQLMVDSLEDLDLMLTVTANSAGETERMFNQSVGSVEKELATLKSMYEGLLISIGKQTSGVVKGVAKLLQNLIVNFKTVGGSILNIASVLVPLLTKKILVLGSTLKTFFAQAAAGAATAKVAMGDWITIVATLVTWIGTALVGAYNRLMQPLRDANAQFEAARTEAIKTKTEVEKLAKAIGDGSNSSSLNSALAQAIKLFPDFADAIRDAAKEARKTGDWERLKQLLQDIADLQSMVSGADAADSVAGANGEYIGNYLYSQGKGGRRTSDVTSGGRARPHTMAGLVAGNIVAGLRGNGLNNESIKQLLVEVGKIIVSSKTESERIRDIQQLLGPRGVNISDEDLSRLISGIAQGKDTHSQYTHGRRFSETGSDARTAAANRQYDIAKSTWISKSNILQADLRDKKIKQKEFQTQMEAAAQAFMDAVYSIDNLSRYKIWEAESLVRGYYPAKTNTGGHRTPPPDNSDDKTKTPKDLVEDIFSDYLKNSDKLKNRLDAGTISQQDFDKEMRKLTEDTWEAITSFRDFQDIITSLNAGELADAISSAYADIQTQKGIAERQQQLAALGKYWTNGPASRDTRFDYTKTDLDKEREDVRLKVDYAELLEKFVRDLEEAIKSGQFDVVADDAIAQLENLKEAARQASEEAESLQHKLNLSEAIVKLNDNIEELKNKQIDNISALANAFDQLYRSIQSISEAFGDKIEWEGFEEFMAVLNGAVQAFEAIKTVTQAVQLASDVYAKKQVLNAAQAVAANQAVTASELEKAAAETTAAAAGAASSVAAIPGVGAALAVAAVAAVIAAIMASANKFAEGGIVSGSKTGDKNLIRANGGEMVLTTAQQANLFNAIKSGNLGGNSGKVDFVIRGTDLVGVLKNYGRVVK